MQCHSASARVVSPAGGGALAGCVGPAGKLVLPGGELMRAGGELLSRKVMPEGGGGAVAAAALPADAAAKGVLPVGGTVAVGPLPVGVLSAGEAAGAREGAGAEGAGSPPKVVLPAACMRGG